MLGILGQACLDQTIYFHLLFKRNLCLALTELRWLVVSFLTSDSQKWVLDYTLTTSFLCWPHTLDSTSNSPLPLAFNPNCPSPFEYPFVGWSNLVPLHI